MVYSIIQKHLTELIDLYGREECFSIMTTLNNSEFFSNKISDAIKERDVPSYEQLKSIVKKSSIKFIFANKRTLIYGSLYFLAGLYRKCEHVGIEIDSARFYNTMRAISQDYRHIK